jgi:hypothetical protein
MVRQDSRRSCWTSPKGQHNLLSLVAVVANQAVAFEKSMLTVCRQTVNWAGSRGGQLPTGVFRRRELEMLEICFAGFRRTLDYRFGPTGTSSMLVKTVLPLLRARCTISSAPFEGPPILRHASQRITKSREIG